MKLVIGNRNEEKGNEELFDMDADPKQYTNLARNPKYTEALSEMRKRYTEKLAEVRNSDLKRKSKKK